VQSASESQGTTGELTKTWATDATVWGSIEPLSARELVQAQQIQSDITHRVTMRYRSDLTVTVEQRILFDSTRVFEIISVLNRDERNEQLELLCKETM